MGINQNSTTIDYTIQKMLYCSIEHAIQDKYNKNQR